MYYMNLQNRILAQCLHNCTKKKKTPTLLHRGFSPVQKEKMLYDSLALTYGVPWFVLESWM